MFKTWSNFFSSYLCLDSFFYDFCKTTNAFPQSKLAKLLIKNYKPLKSEVEVLKTQMDELKKVILDLKQQANNDIWYDGADIKQLFNISESTLIRYR